MRLNPIVWAFLHDLKRHGSQPYRYPLVAIEYYAVGSIAQLNNQNQNNKIMALISFSVFLDKIESGAKVQTIRSLRKYPIKEGEKLRLWWKSRSPKEGRFWGESVCVKIIPIVINEVAVKVGTAIVSYPISLEYFAQRDGFSSWDEMKKYFSPKFGDPLVMIEWEYPFSIDNLQQIQH